MEAGFKQGGEYDFMFWIKLIQVAIGLMIAVPVMYIGIAVSLLAYSLYGPCKRAWQKFRRKER